MTTKNLSIDEILDLFELAVESYGIGQPTFPVLTKEEAKAQLEALLKKLVTEAKIEELMRLAMVAGVNIETNDYVVQHVERLKATLKGKATDE